MASRGGKSAKTEIDPEELLKRKFRAKCLFRALGRLVMSNAHWLIEGVDHYEGLDDVKRRVEQAIRKAKKKHLLRINDKALLNKNAEERTDQEKHYLYRIIGGLKCFKRYPNNVKRKLAAVTYFKYYGPGRIIVRQHHEAHALYFIVTGDVVVSQMILDELLQQYISVDIGTMHPGDMFGEVSLLHNIPRTATVTATDHCELLVLMKEDFKNVLQASVQKQWDEVWRAMSSFSYFEGLDEVARREGCIVAKMKSYAPDEIILGDGVGVANFIYFVLSGRCQMIESLEIITTKHLGRSHYQLYDPYVAKEESEQDFDKKYFETFARLNKNSGVSTILTEEGEPNEGEQVTPEGEGLTSKHESMNVKTLPSALKQENNLISSKRDSVQIAAGEELKETQSISSSGNQLQSQLYIHPQQQSPSHSKFRLSIISETVAPEPRGDLRTYFMQYPLPDTIRHSQIVAHICSYSPIVNSRLVAKGCKASIDAYTRANYSALHLDCEVCQLNPGASFGFGENMRDRRIVALTPVDCMLMPQIWLLQRNTANIWTRIQHYLEKKIPTKKQLFKAFVAERRWQEFKNQVVTDVVARSNTVNYTTVHDVPYSIRMEEMLDL